MNQSGWTDNAAVIVIDPELENWVWVDSPHVDDVLGWRGRGPGLWEWLRQKGMLPPDAPKPVRPKEAVEEALRVARKPRSSSLYRNLAEHVTLETCTDPAFQKFRDTIVSWFSAGPPNGNRRAP